ncbi:3-phenylpropionate/trans-cinnamate dioxygenase ferredoxin reductase subunit [Blastococcus sp. DSM 46786]|uniref:NAD(P)/FAD-dependent oxidoreductase n=1 Tax=Blastococcus sp. DSM 46786 TaxID=1798227 RepID=UPI0008ACE79C|nr:FAD-dependent oxidoreductase [Blastococcus sp. DSM 46786]SEL00891.1 3-phenylpropionate/trans-cinnamate dioxygenase ferredoxin reductase subunit [Blastococcus sp. DSM 46786]
MSEQTLVVVGAGHVAASAARALRRRGFAGPVVLIGDEPVGPYQRPHLSKERLSAGGDDGLWLLTPAWCEANDVTLRTNSTVERIAADTGSVLLADGSSIPADVVVLATGGRPRRLPGVEGERVHYIRTLADSDRLRERLSIGRRIGVLGGGFLGSEIAAAALGRGAEIVVFDRDPVLLARAMGADIGAALTGLHQRRGIDLRLGQAISAIRPGADGVTIVTESGSETVDDLVVCIGIQPNTEVAVRSGLVVGNGVEVDAQGRTSLPNVFAAGDVAAHDHPLYGRVRVEHVDVAQRQAAAIAATVAGRPSTAGDAHWFWTDQYDINVQGLGLTGLRPTDTVVTRGSLADLDGTSFWLRDGLLVGGASIERGEDLSVARELMDLEIPVSAEQLADELVELEDLLEQEEVRV